MFRLLALLMVAAPAFAGQAGLEWTNPTTYEDDSPLPIADLREAVVEWIGCDNGGWPVTGSPQRATHPMPVNTATVPGLAPGSWCFRVAVVSKLDSQSAWSNVAWKIVPPPRPGKPTIIRIDIQTTATLEPTGDGELRLVVR